jgi:hypothetical protein
VVSQAGEHSARIDKPVAHLLVMEDNTRAATHDLLKANG